MKGEQNKGNIENINNIFKLAPLPLKGVGGCLFLAPHPEGVRHLSGAEPFIWIYS